MDAVNPCVTLTLHSASSLPSIHMNVYVTACIFLPQEHSLENAVDGGWGVLNRAKDGRTFFFA